MDAVLLIDGGEETEGRKDLEGKGRSRVLFL